MKEQYYYLMALFDEQTDKHFKLLKQHVQLSTEEPSIFLPHLTLGAYMNVDEEDLCQWVEQQSQKLQQIELNFNHIGLFALKVLFIAPQPSAELVQMHHILHERYDNDYGKIGYNYTIQSNNWVPHVTLLMDESDAILNGLPKINEIFTPFKGCITSLVLYEYNSMRRIRVYELKSL